MSTVIDFSLDDMTTIPDAVITITPPENDHQDLMTLLDSVPIDSNTPTITNMMFEHSLSEYKLMFRNDEIWKRYLKYCANDDLVLKRLANEPDPYEAFHKLIIRRLIGLTMQRQSDNDNKQILSDIICRNETLVEYYTFKFVQNLFLNDECRQDWNKCYQMIDEINDLINSRILMKFAYIEIIRFIGAFFSIWNRLMTITQQDIEKIRTEISNSERMKPAVVMFYQDMSTSFNHDPRVIKYINDKQNEFVRYMEQHAPTNCPLKAYFIESALKYIKLDKYSVRPLCETFTIISRVSFMENVYEHHKINSIVSRTPFSSKLEQLRF